MGIWDSLCSLATKSGKFRNERLTRVRRRKKDLLKPRNLRMEQFENRELLAIGPELVAVIPREGVVLSNGDHLREGPRELTFRFSEGQQINAATIASGIVITRSGGDNQFDAPGLLSPKPDV